MAGHSKWANIQHRKGRQDEKRGKIWTRLIREIVVAARQGSPLVVGEGQGEMFLGSDALAVGPFTNQIAYSPPQDSVTEVRVNIFDMDAVNGHTMGENCRDAAKPDGDVIWTYDKPLVKDAGFLVKKEATRLYQWRQMAMAVYQNGARINEAFGDTVNWDLIPSTAINSIAVVTGPTPPGTGVIAPATSRADA